MKSATEAQERWSLRYLVSVSRRPGSRRAILAWVATVLISIVTGIGVVAFDLGAIPFPLGFTTAEVTLHPSILLGTLLLLWLGPLWAISATYVAAYALGVYAGLPLGANLLFALADPVQLLVVWGGLMVLDVPFEIRTRGNWIFFLALAFTGSVASSLGALVWNQVHQLDFDQGIRIWEGWVIGAFLQGGLLVVPIHHFAGLRVRHWLGKRLGPTSGQAHGPHGGAMILASALVLVAAIALELGLGFVDSVVRADRPEVLLASRLPELGLFVALIFTAFIGTTTLFAIAVARRNERESALARIDGLTGCLNRLAFAEIYSRESDRCERLELPISVIFLDLDRFKAINDEYDYAFGDLVLKATAERVHRAIRDTDYLFRWGGEEFIVLLPHTSEDDAAIAAVRLRRQVSGEPVSRNGFEIQVTASFGVAGAEVSPSSPRGLIDLASDACRLAKRRGRDRVETAMSAVAPRRPEPVRAQAGGGRQ